MIHHIVKKKGYPYICLMEFAEFVLEGLHGKPVLVDVTYQKNEQVKPVVIFSHGFKGFKDWGHFNLVAKEFASNGFVFVKFNFSHNGTTPENPLDFADLEAFGNNNLSIELDDLGVVIDWLKQKDNPLPESEVDNNKIFLLGHSRGGAITILKAAEDNRVDKITTWSAISNVEERWSPETRKQWKKDGVLYILNSRTNQQMPLKYQLLEDYHVHQDRLNIETAMKKLSIPALIIHGTEDEAVPLYEGERLKEWYPKAQFLTIKGAGHTFGGRHPYDEAILPEHTQQVIKATIEFFNQ